MRNRRTSSSPPLLLLSFQDIITAVTAIFLLCTLSLTLDLLRRGCAEVPDPAEAAVDDLAERLKTVTARRDSLALETMADQRTLDAYLAHGVGGLKRQREDLGASVAQLKRDLMKLSEKDNQGDPSAKQAVASAKAEIARLRARVSEVKRRETKDGQQLQDLQNSNALVYNPSSAAGRRTWLLDLSGTRITALAVDDPETRQRIDGAGSILWLGSLHAWLKRRSRGHELLMVLVRPSGIDRWEATERLLQTQGYAYGFDLIAESQQLMLHP